MSLEITEHDDDTVTIEGTRYAGYFFREFGCSFPNMVGQVLRVDKKENGVVTLTRLDLNGTIEKLESIANYLRGMALDPRLLPEHKGYIMGKVAELDAITEETLGQSE